MSILIELHYLPSIAYFAAIQAAGEVIVERNEHYEKQSYRNRCRLVSSQGVIDLIAPTLAPHSGVPITDIRIDRGQRWLNNHWRTIRACYGKAPFFEHYQDDLHDALYANHTFLYDLNLTLLSMCLKWMRSKVRLDESLTYEKSPERRILDLRNVITPKKPPGALEFYKPVAYTQVFGSAFVENASIIDLIFCVGPEAASLIKLSTVQK